MRCFGNANFWGDRTCELCKEVNKEVYGECVEAEKRRIKKLEDEKFLERITAVCIHAEQCMGDFGDKYIGCRLDCCEGDYANCVPFYEGCGFKFIPKKFEEA